MKNMLLKRFNWSSAAVALCLCSLGAQAEISLDYKFPWTEQEVGFRLQGVHSLEAAINRDQIAQGFEEQDYYETLNFFRMLWNEKVYYVAGVQYPSKDEMARIRKDVANKTSSKPVPGGGVCALFVYDKDLKQVAKHDIKINEANGHSWCNGARALARVKGQDALLFAISYYLTDKPLTKKPQDIGDGWRYMTVLLKLREQDGKVSIEQDDACLGNPNGYKDLASARKALSACK